MVNATSSHTTSAAAISQSTPSRPAVCNSQPPSAPPRNAPKNWEVEYTPMAVPLAAAGASLLISDGKLASSRLNAIKKKNSTAHASHRLWPTPVIDARSEEHTSELQSRPHLVCRLLLEK